MERHQTVWSFLRRWLSLTILALGHRDGLLANFEAATSPTPRARCLASHRFLTYFLVRQILAPHIIRIRQPQAQINL